MSFDVAIVGGGMVGATLGVALAPLKLRVALIEAIPHNAASQPSFDERTTALSNGSRRILETLGVWSSLNADATPIRKIHVSDQGRFGFARIDAAEQGLAAQFEIRSIPTIMAIRDGVIVFSQAGMLPEQAVESLIEQVRGLDMDEVRKEVSHDHDHDHANSEDHAHNEDHAHG